MIDHIGPYQLVDLLGEGGMGAVYRARDSKLNRDVAIKVLLPEVASDPERLARFRREAQVLASLNHPNIAHIHGFEDSDGVAALVLELVEGVTLADRIARGPMPLEEALAIARQVVDALEAAHEQGIIHRDLKPANIKLRPDGAAKVLDFGLAKAIDVASDPAKAGGNLTMSPTITSPAQMTRMGMILGTAAYMSPEQARGRVVDRRADIWAFGCVLYEMLAGRRAFEGDDTSITLASVLKDNVDWKALPADTPDAIRRLLRRCLEKDPRKRLSAIADARIEMDEPLASTSEAPASGTVGRPPHSRALWAALGVLAALWIATLVPAWNYFRPTPDDAPPMRFAISTPPGVADPNVAITWHPLISPDGRTIAFAGRDANAPQTPRAAPTLTAPSDRIIWIRPIGADEATPLAATRGARFQGTVPFWSPDSRSLAFVSGSTLYRIDVANGTRQKIFDVPIEGQIAGGTWGRDGTIVYSDIVTGGLYRVPATGGSPTEVARSKSTEVALRLPMFLPDGRHFTYQSAGEGDHPELYVGSLDGGEPVHLTVADSQGLYASGLLLFMRDQVLFAQPFDLEHLQFSGEPSIVANGVYASRGGLGRGAFDASSSGTLVYRTGSATSLQSELTWVNRKGETVGIAGDAQPYYQIRLSPDERRIVAVVRTTDGASTRLSVTDLATGITSGLQEDSNRTGGNDPVWSPDGASVAFESIRHVKRDFFTKTLGSEAETELYASAEDPKWLDDWSHDGRFLLFHSATGLFALPSSGERKPSMLMSAKAVTIDSAHFSHDGHWIAFAVRESNVWQTWVASFPRFDQRRQISSNGGGQAWWRGDDKEIFYLAPDGKMMSVAVNKDTATGALEFKAPQELFQSPSERPQLDIDTYAVTRDGQRFLFMRARNDRGAEIAPISVVINWTATLKH